MKNNKITIIPQPLKIEKYIGKFTLDNDTAIQTDSKSKFLGEYLKNLFLPSTGFNLQCLLINENLNNYILLKISEKLKDQSKEGYQLVVKSDKIIISAPTTIGIFYGIQTLRQLLPVEIESRIPVENKKWNIPCVSIIDYPRFLYRGFMLDEGRHFQGKKKVKKTIELMALHKLNTFHWHLTEDQGWRIQVKKYPLLTDVGSKRNETQIGGYRSFLNKKTDGIPHCGYYTQDDVREIVDYARAYFVSIIPEIDMPGHIVSALAAYPEFGCTGGPYEVQPTFGIKKDVLCLGKELVYDFIEGVLDELIKLFPSDIIHIGGDETPKDRWQKCPDCQKKMKIEKLSDEKELFKYFINRITRYIISKGKIPMGWNEIINEELIKDVIVQHWLRGDKDVLEELRKGRKVVISRFFYMYLDYPYFMTPLKKVYNFEPVPRELEKRFHQNVLGIEAPLWTEWVHNENRFDWQVFPRLTAIAENAWTIPENKNYTSFKKRLKCFYRRMDYLGVKYEYLEKSDPNILRRLVTPFLMFKDPRNYIKK